MTKVIKKINLILFENCVSAYWLTTRISAKIVIDHMDIKNHSSTFTDFKGTTK